MILALLWGLIYFPVACTIAGYTRSIFATLNPFLGLGTIKRIGKDYRKILLMYIVVGFSLFGLSSIISEISLPIDLSWMGNLPALALGSLFTSYFLIVFSAILGFALYKDLDKLNLLYYVKFSDNFDEPLSTDQEDDTERNESIRIFGSQAAIKKSHRIV
jgi:hypothetical protein